MLKRKGPVTTSVLTPSVQTSYMEAPLETLSSVKGVSQYVKQKLENGLGRDRGGRERSPRQDRGCALFCIVVVPGAEKGNF